MNVPIAERHKSRRRSLREREQAPVAIATSLDAARKRISGKPWAIRKCILRANAMANKPKNVICTPTMAGDRTVEQAIDVEGE